MYFSNLSRQTPTAATGVRPWAAGWYRAAAERGHAPSQTNLGLMYECGEGVGRSQETAVVLFAKAAIQGWAAAQNCLGAGPCLPSFPFQQGGGGGGGGSSSDSLPFVFLTFLLSLINPPLSAA